MGYHSGMKKETKKTESFRERLARVIEIGASDDRLSRGYDFFITGIILLNLIVSVLSTIDQVEAAYGRLFGTIETVTAACFAVDYALHLLAAKYIYPEERETRSIAKYVSSFTGIIDLLCFLP